MNATDDITTEESSAVTLDHVTRTYKRDEFEVRALDDVTLDIPRKSFVAIMGPSGSGKTTLLNLVTGIDHATSGRVAVGGEEISTMNEREIAAWRARHIGLETFPLFATVVLAAHITSRDSLLTLWGAHLSFWARAGYLLAAAAGYNLVRSVLFWNTAVTGILLFLFALLW